MERRFADVWDGQGDPVVLGNGDACVALFEPVEGDVVGADGVSRATSRSGSTGRNFDVVRARLADRDIDAKLWDDTILPFALRPRPDGHQGLEPQRPTTST